MSKINSERLMMSIDTSKTLVQDQVASFLVQPLEAASVFLQTGPRIIDSNVPVRIPTLDSSTGAAYVAELGTIGDDDAVFDEVSLLDGVRGVKVICKVSNEARRSSAITLDSIVRDRLVRDVASFVDDQMINGDGGDAGEEMTGLLSVANTTAVDADPGTIDGILAAQAALLAAEVPAGNLKAIVNPAEYSALVSEKATGSGVYQLQPDATRAAGLSVAGVQLFVSSKIAAGTSLVFDPQFVAVGRDTAPQVTLLSERYADQDAIGIRVTARFDVAALRPAAIAVVAAAA